MRQLALLLFGVALTGLLLAFALPPHGWAILGWFAFAPLLFSLRGKGFAIGFGAGIASATLAASIDAAGWLLPRGVEEGTSEWIYAGFLLFGIVGGASAGIFASDEKLRSKPWALAGWAVLLEACLLLVLPAHLALTQSRSTASLALASCTGIWGVSYLLWLSNFWIAETIGKRPIQVMAFLPLFAVGSWHWVEAERGEARAQDVLRVDEATVRVGMIQTRSQDLKELAELNRRAGNQGANIVVWPELSGYSAAVGGDTKALTDLAQTPGQPAFVTTYESVGEPRPYNTAQIFSGKGNSNTYNKRKLFAGERQLHEAGNDAVAVSLGGSTYGLNICFDSCYPSIMRQTGQLPGVGAILLPTLDPDTPRGVAQSIHAAYTPFRAAELGIPIVRADTTANSMIVDAGGIVVEEAGNEQGWVKVADIRSGKRWTLYRYAGDWFLFVSGTLALGGISDRFRRARYQSIR